MNDYKVINCDDGTTVYTGDFYQARAYVENHVGELTVMEADADVADRLARRAALIEATKDDEFGEEE